MAAEHMKVYLQHKLLFDPVQELAFVEHQRAVGHVFPIKQHWDKVQAAYIYAVHTVNAVLSKYVRT